MFGFSAAVHSAGYAHNFSAIHVIRSALAFERDLETSSIAASYEYDSIVLEGKADSYQAIDKAVSLARSLTDFPVINNIEAAY